MIVCHNDQSKILQGRASLVVANLRLMHIVSCPIRCLRIVSLLLSLRVRAALLNDLSVSYLALRSLHLLAFPHSAGRPAAHHCWLCCSLNRVAVVVLEVRGKPLVAQVEALFRLKAGAPVRVMLMWSAAEGRLWKVLPLSLIQVDLTPLAYVLGQESQLGGCAATQIVRSLSSKACRNLSLLLWRRLSQPSCLTQLQVWRRSLWMTVENRRSFLQPQIWLYRAHRQAVNGPWQAPSYSSSPLMTIFVAACDLACLVACERTPCLTKPRWDAVTFAEMKLETACRPSRKVSVPLMGTGSAMPKGLNSTELLVPT